MRFKDLTKTDKELIVRLYESNKSREEIQEILSDMFNVSKRTIRNWANHLEVGRMAKNITQTSKIMVYDIETSRSEAKIWWTGKQYINYKQITKQPSIITIAWKWLGEDQVYNLEWDKDHSDEQMMRDFLLEYNKADMIIGFNNDNFDNRWINARAMKYGLEVNTFVKSMDLMKQEKRLFRMLSYSMDFTSLFAKVERKQTHEGIKMWDMIEDGTPEEQREYLDKMLQYNIGDIVTTEELYLRLTPYLRHKTHFGVLNGEEKWTCPNTGSREVEFHGRTVTPAGTIQIIMKAQDGSTYKISNKIYMDFLDYKMKDGREVN
jgi:uncharacterized protein YprB with RNaseH-like and TPR domain